MGGGGVTVHLATVVQTSPRVVARWSGGEVTLRSSATLDTVDLVVGDQVLVLQADNGGFYAIDRAVTPYGYDRAGLQQATDDIGGDGTLVLEPNAVYTLDTVGPLLLPAGVAGLTIVGNGATIRLSAVAPCAFHFERTADYDVFRNLKVTDLVIDRDNVNPLGRSATIVSATGDQRVNWENITLERIKVVNCPAGDTDPQPNIDHETRHVEMVSRHTDVHEATQTHATGITLRDLDLPGGITGVEIIGQTPGLDTNHWHDDIVVERVMHDTLTDYTSVPLVWSANVHIGSRGHGGTVTLRDVRGFRSGDVGIEVNGTLDLHADNCVIVDAAQAPYLVRNYNTTVVTEAFLARQKATLRGCSGVRDGLVISQADTDTTRGEMFYLGSSLVDLGSVTLRDCSAFVRRQDGVQYQRAVLAARCRRIEIDGFDAVYPQLDSSSGVDRAMGLVHVTGDNTRVELVVRDFRAYVRGTHTGAGTVAIAAIRASAAQLEVDIDGVSVDTVLTGTGYRAEGVRLGLRGVANEVNGRVRAVTTLALDSGDPAASYAVLFEADAAMTTRGLVLSDCDFTLADTIRDVYTDELAAATRDLIIFRRVLWSTTPSPNRDTDIWRYDVAQGRMVSTQPIHVPALRVGTLTAQGVGSFFPSGSFASALLVGPAGGQAFLVVNNEGIVSLGPGDGTFDTQLRRNAADSLYTPDAFRADGGFVSAGDASGLRLSERSAGPTPVGDAVIIYTEDDGAGKTRLMAQFPTGAPKQLEIET